MPARIGRAPQRGGTATRHATTDRKFNRLNRSIPPFFAADNPHGCIGGCRSQRGFYGAGQHGFSLARLRVIRTGRKVYRFSWAIPEWHLLKLLRVAILKDFFACLRPRFHQSWIGFWSFFHSSWFDPTGTISHALFGDQHQ